MAVNAKCLIEVTCSKRPFQKIVKSWSAIGFEWFGANNPVLPKLLGEMRTNKMAVHTDADGTVYTFTPLDEVDL